METIFRVLQNDISPKISNSEKCLVMATFLKYLPFDFQR